MLQEKPSELNLQQKQVRIEDAIHFKISFPVTHVLLKFLRSLYFGMLVKYVPSPSQTLISMSIFEKFLSSLDLITTAVLGRTQFSHYGLQAKS